MKLPNKALVLVADGRKMLFLRNHGDENQIDLRTEAHDEQVLPKDSDIKSDQSGQSPAPGGTGLSGGTMGETNFQQQAEDRWAADAANELRRRVLSHDFEALAVIAPPKTLGELRKHYHKEVERRIVGEMSKEMTDRPIADIEAMLVGKGAPPN